MQKFRSQIAGAQARAGGFTRAELLVLLAIGAVLISLVPPGIQTVREAARRNQIKSKLCDLGILMQIRAGKNDGNVAILTETRLARSNAEDADVKIVLVTVMAIFATLGATFAGTIIKLVVRYFNRRDSAGLFWGSTKRSRAARSSAVGLVLLQQFAGLRFFQRTEGTLILTNRH